MKSDIADILKACLLALGVFALMACLSVASHAQEAAPVGVGIDLPKLTTAQVATGGGILAAVLFFLKGGSLAGIIDLIRKWLGSQPDTKPSLMKILEAIAVLLQVLPVKDQFLALIEYVKTAGLPTKLRITAKWSDGTEKTAGWGDEVPAEAAK